MKKWFLVLLLIAAPFAQAAELLYEGPADWTTFEKFMEKKERDDEILGLSYMIAGVVATVGGVVGYHSSDDPLNRGLYAVAESVGVLVTGYGATYYFIGNEYTSFYRAVDGSSLNRAQKTEILARFLVAEKRNAEKKRYIEIATHSIVAAINFYAASREEDKSVRGLLNFLGVVNLAMAFTYSF